MFWRPRFPEQPRPEGSAEGGGFVVTPEMMSFVGCSGEEFQAILRSLDFRMHKRKVKKPVVAAAPAPEAAAPAEPAPAPEAAAPAPEIASPAREAAAPAEPVPLVETTVSNTEPPPAPVEEEEIEVWWPKDTGPFHRQHKKPSRPKRVARSPRAEVQPIPTETPVAPAEAQKTPSRPRPKARPKPVRAPERQPSPDSPFAVLSELRARLVAKKS